MKKCLLSLLLGAGLTAHAQNNYALSFNGTNYVDCKKNAAFNANNIRTMECWVKFNSLTGSQEILSKSITGQGIELLIYNNTLAAYFMSSGTDGSVISYATSNLQTGVWYHIAVSWDGVKENIRLYVNGAPVGSRSDNGNITTSGLANPDVAFRIGNWSDPTTRYFNGTIDEVRLWSVNRTAAQIKSNMFTIGDQTGLIAHYTMDEGSGSTTANSTATTGITGDLINSPSWVASPVVKNGNALSLDGTNDLVNLGTSSSLKFSSSFTAELWVKSANWAVAGAQQTILSCFESGGYGITLTTDGNLNFLLRTSPTVSGYVGVSYPVSNLTNNTWYHVAGSFDGRYIRMYVNGSLVGTYDNGSSGTIFYTFPSNPVFLGADPTDNATPQGLYFAGQIDEVRLWNTTRTQTEIQSAMNAELDPSNATQTTGLVSYYTFNQGIALGGNSGLITAIDQKGTSNGTLTGFALSGSTSNYVVQNSALFVLPLTWLSFTAQSQEGSQVRLQWSTAQEENTHEFTIQHSTDGRNWNNIGRVAAAGNSNEVRYYSYLHTSPAKGSNQYRIMETDIDGQKSYSQVRLVTISEQDGTTVLSNYIRNNGIQVRLDKPAVIYLYSRDGKLLLKKQLAEGLQTIDVSGFAKGLYFLNISGHTEKIMLQ